MDDGVLQKILSDAVVGTSEASRRLMTELETAAAASVPIIIRGETGTRKDMLAQTIHRISPLPERPFASLSCASGNDVCSQLMRFSMEGPATLFLDEVGDLPPSAQSGLLQILSKRPGIDLISSTSRPLEKLVCENRFREDLLYELGVISIRVPPLRQRPEDIPVLIRRFLKRHASVIRCKVPKIDPEALHSLILYPWPGNIRELENAVRRVLFLSKKPVIVPEDFDFIESIRHKNDLEKQCITFRFEGEHGYFIN